MIARARWARSVDQKGLACGSRTRSRSSRAPAVASVAPPHSAWRAKEPPSSSTTSTTIGSREALPRRLRPRLVSIRCRRGHGVSPSARSAISDQRSAISDQRSAGGYGDRNTRFGARERVRDRNSAGSVRGCLGDAWASFCPLRSTFSVQQRGFAINRQPSSTVSCWRRSWRRATRPASCWAMARSTRRLTASKRAVCWQADGK